MKERIEEIERQAGYMDSGPESEALFDALEMIEELQEENQKLKAKLEIAKEGFKEIIGVKHLAGIDYHYAVHKANEILKQLTNENDK